MYALEDLPEGVPLRFGVEINLAAMAGHAHDRYYTDAAGARLGMLDARLDLQGQDALTLTDNGSTWTPACPGRPRRVSGASRSRRSARGGGVRGRLSKRRACFPHWVVTGDGSRGWEVPEPLGARRGAPHPPPNALRRARWDSSREWGAAGHDDLAVRPSPNRTTHSRTDAAAIVRRAGG